MLGCMVSLGAGLPGRLYSSKFTTATPKSVIYDRTAHGSPYAIGNLVWLHCPAVPKGRDNI